MRATMAKSASRKRRVEERAHRLASLAVRFCAISVGMFWLQAAGIPDFSEAEEWCEAASERCPDSAGKTLSKESELIPPHHCTGVLNCASLKEIESAFSGGQLAIRLQSMLLNCNRICYLLLLCSIPGKPHQQAQILESQTPNVTRGSPLKMFREHEGSSIPRSAHSKKALAHARLSVHGSIFGPINRSIAWRRPEAATAAGRASL